MTGLFIILIRSDSGDSVLPGLTAPIPGLFSERLGFAKERVESALSHTPIN